MGVDGRVDRGADFVFPEDLVTLLNMKVQNVGRNYMRFEDKLNSSGSLRGRRQHFLSRTLLLHVSYLNPLNPIIYFRHHKVINLQFYVLPIQCIYVFYVDLRTNSNYFPVQH